MSVAAQGQAYLAAVKPLNDAVDAFNRALSTDTTQAHIAEAAKPLIAAYRRQDEVLARIAFTGPAATDVRSLIAADNQVASDLAAVDQQTAFSVQTFMNDLRRDLAAGSSAVTLIRADLGLPPAKP